MRLGIFMKGIFALLVFLSTLNAAYVSDPDDIISQQVGEKLEAMASELYTKTGVGLNVAVVDTLDGKSLKDRASEFVIPLKDPYILLFLVKKEHKVEIYNSDSTKTLFDKDQVLSPMPNKGTIIPILVTKKGKDVYNAAILNGFADISDQVATAKGVELENSLGNSNKIVINIIRFFVYGSIIFVLIIYFYRKFRRK